MPNFMLTFRSADEIFSQREIENAASDVTFLLPVPVLIIIVRSLVIVDRGSMKSLRVKFRVAP